MSVTWGSIIEPLFKSKLENYFVNQSVLGIDYTDLYVNNIYTVVANSTCSREKPQYLLQMLL